MKKAATIFITCLVLFSAMGITVAFHYCGKSLQDVAVYGKAKSCCEGNEMPVGCCHNEKVEVKSDDYQQAQQISFAGFTPVLIAAFSFPELDFTEHFHNSSANFQAHLVDDHPPTRAGIILLVHSFLI